MKKVLWSFFEVFETIVIAVVAVVLIRTFVAQPFLVSGASMEPLFHSGDYLLVDELAYRFRGPARGEIVVFKNPIDGGSYYIKRIVGLPTERVVVEGGQIVVYHDGNPQTLNESYAINNRRAESYDVLLGEDEYFVMGDNRGFSFDSRSWGPLEEEDIIGIVRLRLWPVTRVIAVATPAY